MLELRLHANTVAGITFGSRLVLNIRLTMELGKDRCCEAQGPHEIQCSGGLRGPSEANCKRGRPTRRQNDLLPLVFIRLAPSMVCSMRESRGGDIHISDGTNFLQSVSAPHRKLNRPIGRLYFFSFGNVS